VPRQPRPPQLGPDPCLGWTAELEQRRRLHQLPVGAEPVPVGGVLQRHALRQGSGRVSTLEEHPGELLPGAEEVRRGRPDRRIARRRLLQAALRPGEARQRELAEVA